MTTSMTALVMTVLMGATGSSAQAADCWVTVGIDPINTSHHDDVVVIGRKPFTDGGDDGGDPGDTSDPGAGGGPGGPPGGGSTGGVPGQLAACIQNGELGTESVLWLEETSGAVCFDTPVNEVRVDLGAGDDILNYDDRHLHGLTFVCGGTRLESALSTHLWAVGGPGADILYGSDHHDVTDTLHSVAEVANYSTVHDGEIDILCGFDGPDRLHGDGDLSGAECLDGGGGVDQCDAGGPPHPLCAPDFATWQTSQPDSTVACETVANEAWCSLVPFTAFPSGVPFTAGTVCDTIDFSLPTPFPLGVQGPPFPAPASPPTPACPSFKPDITTCAPADSAMFGVACLGFSKG